MVCLAAILGVVFIGNVPGSAAVDNRFPGPYLWGSETWGVSPEALHIVAWLNTHGDSDGRVYSDLFTNELVYSRTPLGVNSGDDASEFALFFESKPVDIKTWNHLRNNGFTYIVIDRRWSNHVGFNVTPFSPQLSGKLTSPVALDRYNSYSWAPLVYQSSNYSIYALNYDALPGSVK